MEYLPTPDIFDSTTLLETLGLESVDLSSDIFSKSLDESQNLKFTDTLPPFFFLSETLTSLFPNTFSWEENVFIPILTGSRFTWNNTNGELNLKSTDFNNK